MCPPKARSQAGRARLFPTALRRILLLFAAVVFVACAGPYPGRPQSTSFTAPEVRTEWAALAPNDKLSVIVWGHPEASTPADGQRLDAAGILSLPLLGPIELAGLTAEQARGEIASRASAFIRDPRVTLSVIEFGARDFYVLGHIQNVGPHRIDRPLNALQALSYGGPFLVGASRSTVFLIREGEGELDVYEFSASLPGPAGQMPVQPGDMIFVPRSGHGHFAEDILPYLQGLGFATTFPVAIHAISE